MSRQDSLLEEKLAEDHTTEEDGTPREQHSQEVEGAGVDTEIQLGPHEPPSASDGSTVGVPSPRAIAIEPNSEIATMMQSLTQVMAQLVARLERLEAAAPSAASAAPAPEAPAAAVGPLALVQPLVEHSYIRHSIYSHKLRKFGGKDASGDISDWVHHARFMVPMMSTSGKDGEPERLSMILQALEGHARIVAENVIEDPNRPRDTITWEIILDELLLSFGDPDAERSARRELNELKQKLHEDVVTYLARFDTLAHRITGLTDKDAVSRLESGLREPYKSRVNNVYLQQKVSDPDFEFSPLSLKTLLKRTHTMEQQNPTLGLNTVTDGSSHADGTGSSHRVRPQRFRGKNPLSDEERERRYREKKCFKCNGDWERGHVCGKQEPSPNGEGVQSPHQ